MRKRQKNIWKWDEGLKRRKKLKREINRKEEDEKKKKFLCPVSQTSINDNSTNST